MSILNGVLIVPFLLSPFLFSPTLLDLLGSVFEGSQERDTSVCPVQIKDVVTQTVVHTLQKVVPSRNPSKNNPRPVFPWRWIVHEFKI